MTSRGRPPKPLDPDASAAAWLGAELRSRREAQGLTLQALSGVIDFSPQHISEVERAKAWPSGPFIRACDDALEARGRLLALLPAVERERAVQRQERAAARRAERRAPVRCGATDGEDEDVDPVNRRRLIGAGAAAALGAAGVAAPPTQGRDVDPELHGHWTRLLSLLGSQNAMFGPHDVLAAVRREIGLITEHRQVARGELRTDLMRVEARWAAFAAWLSNDTGQRASRDAWMNRALRLAREAGYADMVAFVHMRQSQWAAQALDANRTLTLAEAGLRVPGISPQTRARLALREAFGHALANDADACERGLAAAEGPLELATDPPSFVQPWVGRATIRSHLRPDEARCWLHMRPSKAIALYENVLRQWPRDQRAMGGLHQARLALACAAAGEHDRATVEGRKALAVARRTGSGRAARELRRLREVLGAA